MQKSLELAEKAVELAPDNPAGYRMLGNLALSKGDHDRAIALSEHALILAPNDYSLF